MKTAFQVNSAGAQSWQPALPDTSVTSAPTSNATSVSTTASDWVDYRGVPAGAEAGFYKDQDLTKPNDTGRQTTKRVIIRSLWSLNQGM